MSGVDESKKGSRGGGTTTTGAAGSMTTTTTTSDIYNKEEMYLQQIENLKEQVLLKDKEMSDLQRGLEAQVRMVMELEELEQKELQEYERKLEANRRLIHELGDRVGQESKAKAELESQLMYIQRTSYDQAIQIERLTELNQVQKELLQDQKQQLKNRNHSNDDSNNNKLDYMMQTNQKLVMELAQSQEDIQKVRKDVSDKELLCLQLSSQLDKLASQLNNADELMADVKYQLEAKEKELAQAKARVVLLEASLMETDENHNNHAMAGTSGGENNSNNQKINKQMHLKNVTKGMGVLVKTLKEKEEECAQFRRERDASLAKATKLSLALASCREYNDALSEKLEYQNSIVDRILGKRSPNPPPKQIVKPVSVVNVPPVVAASAAASAAANANPNAISRNSFATNHNPTGSAAMPTRETPRRAKSFGTSPFTNQDQPTPQQQPKAGPFDGRRIRNFFGRAGSGGVNDNNNSTSTNNNNNTTNMTMSPQRTKQSTEEGGGGGRLTPIRTTSRLLQRLKADDNSESNNNINNHKAATGSANPPSLELPLSGAAKGGGKGRFINPFDYHDSFTTNPTLGKASPVDENVQGGGGDINCELTV